MVYLWSILLILVNAFWLLFVLFGLPGNWLIVISSCLFAWWRAEDGVFSIHTLFAITALAVLGELVEFFGGMGGAKKAGAGWRGALGALLGAVTGAILGTFAIPIPFFWHSSRCLRWGWYRSIGIGAFGWQADEGICAIRSGSRTWRIFWHYQQVCNRDFYLADSCHRSLLALTRSHTNCASGVLPNWLCF